jgi:hypothetical protein
MAGRMDGKVAFLASDESPGWHCRSTPQLPEEGSIDDSGQ